MTGKPLAGIDAIVLAGGLGSRLRPVLADRQKVLAEVTGRPFIARLIEQFARAGAPTIVLATGHYGEQVAAFAEACAADNPGTRILISAEPEPRGTGGAARLALDLTAGDPVLVANGDSFADVDLAALRALHERRAAAATLALAEVEDGARYGRVETGEDGRIRAFREKASALTGPATINAGVYLFRRATLAAFPVGTALSLEREVFPALIAEGIYGLRRQIPFIDIGTPESWRAADQFFARLDQARPA